MIRKIPQHISYIALGVVCGIIIAIVVGIAKWYGLGRGWYASTSVSTEGEGDDRTQLMEFVGWEYISPSGDIYLFDRNFTLSIPSFMHLVDTQTGWSYGLIRAQVRGVGAYHLVSELHSIDNTAPFHLSSTQLAYLMDHVDRLVAKRTDYFFHRFGGILVYVPRRVRMQEIEIQSLPRHSCYGSWEAREDDRQVFIMTLCDQPKRKSYRANADHSILIGDMIMYIHAKDTSYPIYQITLFSEKEFLSFIPSEEGKNGEGSE